MFVCTDLKDIIGVIKVLLKNLLTSFTDTFMSPVVWILALGRKIALLGLNTAQLSTI